MSVTSENEINFSKLYEEVKTEEMPQIFDRTFAISKDNLIMASHDPPDSALLDPEHLKEQRVKTSDLSQNEKIKYFMEYLKEAFYRFDKSLLSPDGFTECIRNMGIKITSQYEEVQKKKSFELTLCHVILSLSNPVEDADIRDEYFEPPTPPIVKRKDEQDLWSVLQSPGPRHVKSFMDDKELSTNDKLLLMVKELSKGTMSSTNFVRQIKSMNLKTNNNLNTLLVKTDQCGDVSFKEYAQVILNKGTEERQKPPTIIKKLNKKSNFDLETKNDKPNPDERTLLSYFRELKGQVSPRESIVDMSLAKERKQVLLQGNLLPESPTRKLKADGVFHKNKQYSQINIS